MKLTNEQTGKLVDIWRRIGGLAESLEAILSAYEEMRPRTEPAQVTWRRGVGLPLRGTIYTDGEGISISQFHGCKYHLTREDLLSLPFPAEPTPEELVEREFEGLWSAGLPIKMGSGYKDVARRFFMAAKLSAGGNSK